MFTVIWLLQKFLLESSKVKVFFFFFPWEKEEAKLVTPPPPKRIFFFFFFSLILVKPVIMADIVMIWMMRDRFMQTEMI